MYTCLLRVCFVSCFLLCHVASRDGRGSLGEVEFQNVCLNHHPKATETSNNFFSD